MKFRFCQLYCKDPESKISGDVIWENMSTVTEIRELVAESGKH